MGTSSAASRSIGRPGRVLLRKENLTFFSVWCVSSTTLENGVGSVPRRRQHGRPLRASKTATRVGTRGRPQDRLLLGARRQIGRGTGRHRRPDAAGREHFGAPVVGAGAARPHLVAQLGRHHPQELVPLLRQRLRRLHRTLPAGPRLPLPAETATTTTATTTTAAAAAAAAAARSRKQSVVSVPVSSFSSLPWRRRAR